MKPISKTVKAMQPSGIRKFFDIVSQMSDVVSLGVGEPDFVTPWRVREAAIFAIEKGYTNYTSNYGMIELRKALSEHLRKTRGLDYSPENQILVSVGVSEALDLAMRAILNPGDEVIVPEPSFVAYKACVTLAGGSPVVVATSPETGFAIDPDEIERAVTEKTKAIMIGHPSNPTGAVMSGEQLRGLMDVARKHDLYVISDEVYDQLTYDAAHVCAATLPGAYERTILLNGFSKAYAMTGWRLGYAAANREIIDAMTKVHQYTMMCASIVAQMAAIEAIKNGDPDMHDMVRQYDQRRKVIVKGLNDIGLPCAMPGGAFYAFPSIAATGLSSEEFSERLLHEEKVAVVPGNAFGDCGEGFIRCSYATALDKIEVALERMGRFVGKNHPAIAASS